MSRYLSSRFSRLDEYVPGEQPRNMKYIKLNTNESPYPPSRGVLDALDRSKVEKLNLYSDPDCRDLIRAIAKHYDTDTGNVFVSNGSDDTLNLCFMGFCDRSTPVVFPDITYGFYEVYADLYLLDYTKIPLRGDFSLDYENYCGVNKTVVIANPNANTGMAIPVSQVENIVKSNPDNVVVIDEAYVDFGWESCVPLTKKYDNILVCMTYSKSRCLAGARLGFAIGSRPLIADLNKLKDSINPYSVNSLTQLAGIAALNDQEYYDDCCRRIIRTREHTRAELVKRGFGVTDSSSNFLLARCDKLDGTSLYSQLKTKGILVRHFNDERIRDYIRITIGTDEQSAALLNAIDDILGGTK